MLDGGRYSAPHLARRSVAPCFRRSVVPSLRRSVKTPELKPKTQELQMKRKTPDLKTPELNPKTPRAKDARAEARDPGAKDPNFVFATEKREKDAQKGV